MYVEIGQSLLRTRYAKGTNNDSKAIRKEQRGFRTKHLFVGNETTFILLCTIISYRLEFRREYVNDNFV